MQLQPLQYVDNACIEGSNNIVVIIILVESPCKQSKQQHPLSQQPEKLLKELMSWVLAVSMTSLDNGGQALLRLRLPRD